MSDETIAMAVVFTALITSWMVIFTIGIGVHHVFVRRNLKLELKRLDRTLAKMDESGPVTIFPPAKRDQPREQFYEDCHWTRCRTEVTQ